MELIGWILFGFIVGLLARVLMPGRDKMGFVGTTFLGVLGALLGGWLGQVFGIYQAAEGAGLIGALLGAIVVLWVYNIFRKRNRVRRKAQIRARRREARSPREDRAA